MDIFIKKKKYVLEGVFSGMCQCGKCNVPSYPGRVYDKKWDCATRKWKKFDWIAEFGNTLPTDGTELEAEGKLMNLITDETWYTNPRKTKLFFNATLDTITAVREILNEKLIITRITIEGRGSEDDARLSVKIEEIRNLMELPAYRSFKVGKDTGIL